MVCSNRAEFSCDNLCGNPLPCGNHYCTYVCHAFKSHSSKSGESCEECNLPCEKVSSCSGSLIPIELWTPTKPLSYLIASLILDIILWLGYYSSGTFLTKPATLEFRRIYLTKPTTFNISIHLIVRNFYLMSSHTEFIGLFLICLWSSSFRRDIQHVHILAPCHVTLGSVLLARHSLNVHVIVGP